MLANMVCSLITENRITTTLAKAKELRPIVEKLVTLARAALPRVRQPVLVVQSREDNRIPAPSAAAAFGIELGGVTFMIHCGSRGFGHQVCDDFLKTMRGAARKYGFDLPDQQLCCAPVDSDEGREYLGAMRAAANYAWANRQMLMALVREAVPPTRHVAELQVA